MPSDAAAVIGKSVQIRGEVKGNEDLTVEGQVDGTIALTDSRLTVGAHARVSANLSARDVIVLGHVTGEIRATGRVELRAGSTVSGDIHAGRLSIEENAVYCGKVELTSSAVANAGTGAGTERTATAPHVTAAPAASNVALGAN